MSKFTPGAWAVHPIRAQVDGAGKTGMIPICSMLWPTDERSEAETEANAYLIAAAPDIYEELIQANDIIRKLGEWIMAHEHDTEIVLVDIRLPERRAAIAKAEGRE